nr:methylamine utilization protein [Paraglaciecola sp. 20A4]
MKNRPVFYTKHKHWLSRLVLTTISLLIFSVDARQDIHFKVVDQFGTPVANAVVSTHGASLNSPQAPAVMDQINKQFAPHVLVVQKGQSVRFPNSDDIRHHIYSFSQPKPFEIRLFKGEESSPVTFEQPGVVVLGCNIHDQMIGYIYIADHELTALTDENGEATLHTQATEFNIWQPKLSSSHSERIHIVRDAADVAQQKVTLPLLEETNTHVKKRTFSRKFSSGDP